MQRTVARPGRGRRMLFSAVLLTLTASAQLALPFGPAGTASAAPAPAASAVAPASNVFGFPSWYQDESGTRLEACTDPADPYCVVLAAPGVYDPLQPTVFPSNFPDEHFYLLADSDRLRTPGCRGTKKGRAFVRLALESAFVNGAPAPGEQMTFGRVRIVVTGGLCPNQPYTFTHPFGSVTMTTDSAGAIARNAATTDVGCIPVAPQTCDFSVALSSPVAKSFLRWDPAVAPAAPAGYLGDATTPHPIVGAIFDPGTGPANYFSITSGTRSIARTELFTVAGKIAGPVVASVDTLAFGGRELGAVGGLASLTLTNIGLDAVTLGVANTSGTDFGVVANACSGVTLDRDRSCSVTLLFTPSALGGREGALSIGHSGLRSPVTVKLAGTGINPGATAMVSPAPTALDFGRVRVLTESPAQTVTVSNTGTAPMRMSSIEILDLPAGTVGDRLGFRLAADSCSGFYMPAGSSCSVALAFSPTSAGAKAAAARFTTENGSTGQVSLAGLGWGGVAAVAPTMDPATGFADWYQDENATRLAACIDPLDPNCVVLPDVSFDPALALSPRPGFVNFPSEHFYFLADSDVIATPGCAGSAPGRAFVRAAAEAAFLNGAPFEGEQITFGRIRIVVTSGLCPNSTYTFTHPYGQTVVTTDSAGGVRRNAATTDVGCFPVAPAVCDFSLALASPVMGGFLSWDPSVVPAPPAGYLGDAATLHEVVGAPFTAPGETTPANYVSITGPAASGGPATTIGSTSLFTVMGKLAAAPVPVPPPPLPVPPPPPPGPVLPPLPVPVPPPVLVPPPLPVPPPVLSLSRPSLDLGKQKLGRSRTRSLTITNTGGSDLLISALTISGSSDFAVTRNDCGVALAPAALCTIDVTFTPSSRGVWSAALVIDTNAGAQQSVTLVGTGR